MQSELLWVMESSRPKDRRQKELEYAARKAHAAANAHRKRRQGLLSAQESNMNADEATRETGITGQPTNQHLDQEQLDCIDRELFVTSQPASRHMELQLASKCCKERATHLQVQVCSPSLCKEIPDRLESRVVQVSPLLRKAINFVRFYLSKNCAPSFISQQVNAKGKGRADPFSGPIAAGWMWGLFVSDNGTFWSAVASVLPIMKKLLPEEEKQDLERLSLALKAESMACLRRKLAVCLTDVEISINVIYHVKTLFREACLGNDVLTARRHAEVLSWLTEKLPNSTDDVILRRVALWSDATSALLQFRRPVLPYSSWMPRSTSKIWSSAESVLPSFDLVDTKLSECILSPLLRAAFLHIRFALHVAKVTTFGEQSDSVKRAELIFQWMVTKAEHHICGLLNFYFDAAERNQSGLSGDGKSFMESALALALLYLLQKNFCDVIDSDGIDIHESAGVIHPVLLDALRQAERCCSASEWNFYRPAYVWLLSIGVQCEKSPQLSGKKSLCSDSACNLSSSWFHIQLASEVTRKWLSNEEDLRSTFSLFVLHEWLMP